MTNRLYLLLERRQRLDRQLEILKGSRRTDPAELTRLTLLRQQLRARVARLLHRRFTIAAG